MVSKGLFSMNGGWGSESPLAAQIHMPALLSLPPVAAAMQSAVDRERWVNIAMITMVGRCVVNGT